MRLLIAPVCRYKCQPTVGRGVSRSQAKSLDQRRSARAASKDRRGGTVVQGLHVLSVNRGQCLSRRQISGRLVIHDSRDRHDSRSRCSGIWSQGTAVNHECHGNLQATFPRCDRKRATAAPWQHHRSQESGRFHDSVLGPCFKTSMASLRVLKLWLRGKRVRRALMMISQPPDQPM